MSFSADFLVRLFVLHAALTWAVGGIMWYLQIVHYPLMSRVGREHFPAYEAFHTRRTVGLVVSLMVLETATGSLLALTGPAHRGVLWAGLILLGVNWFSTFRW